MHILSENPEIRRNRIKGNVQIDDGNGLKANFAENDGERVKRAFKLGLELDPSEEKIIDHGDPDLGQYRIF